MTQKVRFGGSGELWKNDQDSSCSSWEVGDCRLNAILIKANRSTELKGMFEIQNNKTNHPISSNSHPSATANKQYTASK